MKYIMLCSEILEHHYPVVFPDEISHKSVAKACANKKAKLSVASAGFVGFDEKEGQWIVDQEAKSDSLGIGPLPGDQLLLNFFLKQGLCGIQLQNTLALLSLGLEAAKKKK